MSIRDDINEAVRAGRLIKAQPIAPWAPQPRVFLMCTPLWSAIIEGRGQSTAGQRDRWAKLQADISHFIEGGRITEDRFKQLDDAKHENWELRSVKPKPSLRVFGRFAEPDVFVGTHVKQRKDLSGKWDLDWELEKLICEDHWKNAGLPEPFTAPPDYKYSDYITENAEKKHAIPE
jgi:hypothetical protein